MGRFGQGNDCLGNSRTKQRSSFMSILPPILTCCSGQLSDHHPKQPQNRQHHNYHDGQKEPLLFRVKRAVGNSTTQVTRMIRPVCDPFILQGLINRNLGCRAYQPMGERSKIPKHKADTDPKSNDLEQDHSGTRVEVAIPSQHKATATDTNIRDNGSAKDQLLNELQHPVLTWDDILKQIEGDRWLVLTNNERIDASTAEEILDNFQLHHKPGTAFIFESGTNNTVAACDEGVFMFSMDFDSACLMSSNLSGALKYMTTPGIKFEGPVKQSGEPFFE